MARPRIRKPKSGGHYPCCRCHNCLSLDTGTLLQKNFLSPRYCLPEKTNRPKGARRRLLAHFCPLYLAECIEFLGHNLCPHLSYHGKCGFSAFQLLQEGQAQPEEGEQDAERGPPIRSPQGANEGERRVTDCILSKFLAWNPNQGGYSGWGLWEVIRP